MIAGCSFVAARPGTPHACEPNKLSMAVDASVAFAGVASAVVADSRCEATASGWCLGPKTAEAASILTAGSFILAAGYGAVLDECPSEHETLVARVLVERVALAARSGDCDAFERDGPRVLDLDRNVYERELLEQPEIHACVVAKCWRERAEIFERTRDIEDNARRQLARSALPQCEE